MKKTLLAAVLPAWLLAGCAFGPDHLPALYSQRDHFQRLIDDVQTRMLADQKWWDSLSPERRLYWKSYLEKVRTEERERALNAIQQLTEGLEAVETGGAAKR